MRTWLDVLFITILVGGFACFVAGYTIMVRHVWHMPDRRERIKKMLGKDDFMNYPPAGPRLIALGALCGVIIFCGFGSYILLSTLR